MAPVDSCVQQLLAYVALLRRWNTAFNLVGRSDVHRLIERHVLDGLQLGQVLQPGRESQPRPQLQAGPAQHPPNLLDIGSGAGLPGMVLAIAFPELQVTLLERAPRRARFLVQTQAQLKLPNLRIVNGDAAVWRNASPFAFVTARAVASGDVLGEMVRPHLASTGVLVAQFGALQDERHIPSGFSVLHTREYRLPGNPALYRLLVLRNDSANGSAAASRASSREAASSSETSSIERAPVAPQGTPRG